MEGIAVDHDIQGEIARRGFAWIPGSAWSFSPAMDEHWRRLCQDWDHLEPDRYLKAGATFRRRRYGRYYWAPASGRFQALPPQPYFQPEEENAYAGGVVREFASLLADSAANPFLDVLTRFCFRQLPLDDSRRSDTWEVRIHQIRVVATCAEPGEPSPEGIHQDGTDFLTLHLVRRRNITGGETTIYDLARNPICSHTFRETMDSLILQDSRIMHGVTRVYPADGVTEGVRDLLGLDFIHDPTLRPV
jgi:hypothetical protein